MELSNLRPAEGSKHSDASERAADTDPETERRQARAIRDRRRVPALPGPALRAVRCPYTEGFPREASQTGIPR